MAPESEMQNMEQRWLRWGFNGILKLSFLIPLFLRQSFFLWGLDNPRGQMVLGSKVGPSPCSNMSKTASGFETLLGFLLTGVSAFWGPPR